MIGFVDGILDCINEDSVCINVNGFGINVFVSNATLSNLPSLGENIKLYTYTSVREDAFWLYGFLDKNDLDMFKKCITVSGIGPKGALTLLSSLSTNDLKLAIFNDDAKAISAAPGIGLKTAQRLILELKNKLDFNSLEINAGISDNVSSSDNLQINEAVQALISLGYTQQESIKAIRNVKDLENLDSGQILKAALKFLF